MDIVVMVVTEMIVYISPEILLAEKIIGLVFEGIFLQWKNIIEYVNWWFSRNISFC